jgi:molybdopterin converting factor small subunit
MHPKVKYFSEKYPANGERGSAVDDEKIDATLEQVDVKEGAEVKFFPQFTGPM